MATPKLNQLTNGKLLIKNTVFSLIGQGLPLCFAIFTIPVLVKGLGTERFGVLTLAWVLISYFSLFDLGLGRALTKLMSEKIGIGENQDTIAKLVWTAFLLMLILGCVGTTIFIFLSPWLIHGFLKLSDNVQEETLRSFYYLSISIPVVTSSAGFVGVLSALQRFDLINAVRIPLGLFMFIGPVLILPFSTSLEPIVITLLIGRLIFGYLYWRCCIVCMPALKKRVHFSRASILPLVKFGSWMTVSTTIGPIMLYMDRFLIGSMISAAAVAYYTTPYEIVTKTWIIPSALVSVLFPAFSTSFSKDFSKTLNLFKCGIKYIFLVLYPIIFVLIAYSYEGLNLWLGKDFSQNSTPVLQCLSIGVLLSGISQVPLALIQALGRPDALAKLHIIELPIYGFLLWVLTRSLGITGTAYAWTIRILIDMIAIFAIANSLILNNLKISYKTFFCLSSLAIIFPFFTFQISAMLKLCLVALILSTFFIISWLYMLDVQERKWIRGRLQTISNSKNFI